MTRTQTQAKTILGILEKIEDQAVKNELVLLFAVPYLEHTREMVAGLKEEVLVEKILEFLRAVAEGKITIGDESQEFITNLPDLEELVDAFEEAQKRGLIEESQVRKAMLRALLARKREEQLSRLRKEEEGEELRKIYKARPGPPRIISPRNEKDDSEKEPAKETPKDRLLLLKISYLNRQPSIVNTALEELSKIPLSIPEVAFGETVPGLLSLGASPEALEKGIKKFQEDRPGTEKNPAVQALLEEADILRGFLKTYPDIQEKYGLLGEMKVEVFFPTETGATETKADAIIKLVGISLEKGAEGSPKLILSSLKMAESQAAEPPTTSTGFLQNISRTIKNALPLSVSRLVNSALSFLGRIRPYLGGALVVSSLVLPLPVPLRIAMATFGFVLGREKFVAFLENVSLGVFKTVRGYSFSGGLSSSFKNLVSAIFTKPTLGWLRTTLAMGGIGSLLLPIPLPLRLVFATFGGSLGLTQAAMSIGRWGGALSRISLGLSRGTLALSAGATAPVWGWVALAVIIGVVGIGFISYLNIQGSQKLFLTSGAAAVPQESRFIQITKSAAPQNIKNDELPKTVEFTIVVTAREQALTISSIKETFAALAKDKTITIPEKTLTPPKTRLSPGESTEIKFSINFDKNFEDSAVTATTALSASVDGQAATETASASTTVIVGSPPTSCIVFDNARLPWQDSGATAYKSWVIQAIAYISQSQAYIAKLCEKGPVFLERGHRSLDVGDKDDVAGMAPAALGNRVYLFDKAFTGYLQLRYVLAHELGHIYAYRHGDTFKLFETVVNPQSDPKKGETFLKTYPLAKSAPEDFPETIALYVVWETTSIGNYGIINMPAEYPKHYAFAREQIFGLFEYK